MIIDYGRAMLGDETQWFGKGGAGCAGGFEMSGGTGGGTRGGKSFVLLPG